MYAQLFENESIENVGRGGAAIEIGQVLEFLPHLNVTKFVFFAIKQGAKKGTLEATKLVICLVFGEKALQKPIREALFEYLKTHSVQNLPEPRKLEIVCAEALTYIAKSLETGGIPYKDKQQHT